MNQTAVINFKTDPGTKKAAQDFAHQIGLPLSRLLNLNLKNILREGAFTISTEKIIPQNIEKKWEKERTEVEKEEGFVTPESFMKNLINA